MTNVTGVLHILIGTYELLNFRNLSGQASRRGLDLHFPRYLFQHDQDRQDFQGVLLALLKQVPLSTDIPALMPHWFYFYERSIGCVGILKDWLTRAVAAALHDGDDTLTLELAAQHALTLSQCERMALDAIKVFPASRAAPAQARSGWLNSGGSSRRYLRELAFIFPLTLSRYGYYSTKNRRFSPSRGGTDCPSHLFGRTSSISLP